MSQLGNKNQSKTAQRLDAAIKKVIASKGKDEKGISIALFNLMNKQYDMALAGDIAAQKEFLDRYAGKVKNTVDVETTQYLVMVGGEKMLDRQPIDVTPEKIESSH